MISNAKVQTPYARFCKTLHLRGCINQSLKSRRFKVAGNPLHLRNRALVHSLAEAILDVTLTFSEWYHQGPLVIRIRAHVNSKTPRLMSTSSPSRVYFEQGPENEKKSHFPDRTITICNTMARID